MEAIGRLAGGVAHDFNNLLTVINGYSELLLRDADRRRTRGRPVREIAQGRRAGGRADPPAPGVQPPAGAPSRRCSTSTRSSPTPSSMLRRLIGEDIELVTAPGSRTWGRCRPTPAQIEQVLMNLAVNARDAMPTAGSSPSRPHDVELDDAVRRGAPSVAPGPYVRARRQRTPAAAWTRGRAARIFEPFFTTKEAGQGDRAGPGHGLRHRRAERRRTCDVTASRAAARTFKVYLPAVPPEPRRRAARRWRDGRAARARRRSCSSRTSDAVRDRRRRGMLTQPATRCWRRATAARRCAVPRRTATADPTCWSPTWSCRA